MSVCYLSAPYCYPFPFRVTKPSFLSSGYDCLHPYHLEAKSNALGRLSYQDLCNSWLPQSHSLVPSAFYFSMCLGEHICSQKLFCALDWKISHKHHEINMAPTFSQWPYSIYLALSATALFDYLKLSAGMIQWLEAQDHLLTYSNLFPRSSSLFPVPDRSACALTLAKIASVSAPHKCNTGFRQATVKFLASKHAQVSRSWKIVSKQVEKGDGVCPGTLHPRMCIQITREPCYNAHSDSVGLSQDLDFYTNKLPGDTDSDGPRAILSNKEDHWSGCWWPSTVELLKAFLIQQIKNNSHFKTFKVFLYLSWGAHCFSWVIIPLL